MKWIVSTLVFAGVAVAAHVATLNAVPGLIMDRTMATMAERGIPLHTFVLAPAATPQNQTVVRPSPDLAYSICRYDLDQADGAIELRAGAFDGYGSIAVFDDRTNNIAAIRVPEGEEVSAILSADDDADILAASSTGLILIRRLAPDAGSRARVEQAAEQDACAPV